MKLKLYLLFISFTFLSAGYIQAQLFIDNSYTVEEMVMDFFDNSCVTPSNITYAGSTDAVAFFDAGNIELGVQAGIFFSTGEVFTAAGPNTNGGTTGNMNTAGDPDLSAIVGGASYDGSILEMDIVATGNQLDFSYVFASEEYPEFVNSGFNDIFAFFISGPGISGLQNIAMVPNLPDPVSINTINDLTNSQYYIDNAGGQDISFDGYTTELIASTMVTPNETYHIKIAIADISDSAFDSGIFLGIESLCGDSLLVPPAESNLSVDGSTVTFENNSKYATSFFWDFGDNTTSTEKVPAPHTYAVDGFYDITLITYNYCCSDTVTTQVTIGTPNGVNDLELKPYSFSPNPVSDFANLKFENGESFELKIYDATGRILTQKSGVGNTELGFENYNPGVYFLELSAEGKIYRDKFLKL
jgi:PKD repeat protein